MKRAYGKSYSRQVAVLVFLFVFFVGTFGLVTVWLRQQIAETATRARAMERRLVEIERHESRLTGEIAIAMSPAFLDAQNRRFDLGLRPASPEQVVRIDSTEQIQFARRRWDRLVTAESEGTLTFYEPARN